MTLLRTIIATMQDLGFVIDSADETLGTVSGTNRANFYSLIMTVSVRPKGEDQMIVRSNARYNLQTVTDRINLSYRLNASVKTSMIFSRENGSAETVVFFSTSSSILFRSPHCLYFLNLSSLAIPRAPATRLA